MAHSRHTTPHISDIQDQIRWEMQGVERGVQRAREAMAEQSVASGALGTRLMQRCVPLFVKQIEAAQKEATDGLAAARKGAPAQWWWLILCLEPEQLAVAALNVILTRKPRDFTFNIAVTAAATTISSAIHQQLDFERWKEAENARTDGENNYLRFLRSTKNVDAKTFKRFSERIERVRLERWDMKTGITFGVKLIQLLVQAVPEWFSLEHHRLRGGRNELQIVMTAECRDTIADIAEQTELSRPMMLPMICPPAEWRRLPCPSATKAATT